MCEEDAVLTEGLYVVVDVLGGVLGVDGVDGAVVDGGEKVGVGGVLRLLRRVIVDWCTSLSRVEGMDCGLVQQIVGS